jgi:hypothetical protein
MKPQKTPGVLRKPQETLGGPRSHPQHPAPSTGEQVHLGPRQPRGYPGPRHLVSLQGSQPVLGEFSAHCNASHDSIAGR